MSFVRGEPSAAWPRLQYMRAQSAFVPVLEQSIERRHALLHQRIKSAPRHSAAFVSLCERKEEILALISAETGGREAIEQLSKFCEVARAPALVATSLGLARREEFAEYFDIDSAEIAVGIPHCLVASVVYRCDLKAQYTALPTVHNRPYNPWYLGVQHPGPAPALMDGDVGGADGESSAPAEPRSW